MKDNVFWILQVAIQPGRFDDVKTLMSTMTEATQKDELDTLNYEWSISFDQTVCHIYERYKDSAAVLTHMRSFNANFATEFLAVLKPVRFVVYGTPSAAVKEVISGLNPIYMSPFGGFDRQ